MNPRRWQGRRSADAGSLAPAVSASLTRIARGGDQATSETLHVLVDARCRHLAGASLFGPRWGIPLMPVAGLGTSRAAVLKLAVWRQDIVAVPGRSPSSHDPDSCASRHRILVQ
jgi:hypothetical protein